MPSEEQLQRSLRQQQLSVSAEEAQVSLIGSTVTAACWSSGMYLTDTGVCAYVSACCRSSETRVS
jgi:hypothetical protein